MGNEQFSKAQFVMSPVICFHVCMNENLAKNNVLKTNP